MTGGADDGGDNPNPSNTGVEQDEFIEPEYWIDGKKVDSETFANETEGMEISKIEVWSRKG